MRSTRRLEDSRIMRRRAPDSAHTRHNPRRRPTTRRPTKCRNCSHLPTSKSPLPASGAFFAAWRVTRLNSERSSGACRFRRRTAPRTTKSPSRYLSVRSTWDARSGTPRWVSFLFRCGRSCLTVSTTPRIALARLSTAPDTMKLSSDVSSKRTPGPAKRSLSLPNAGSSSTLAPSARRPLVSPTRQNTSTNTLRGPSSGSDRSRICTTCTALSPEGI